MRNSKQLIKQRELMQKLDTVAPDLESLLPRNHQRPVGWKLLWLNSLLARRTEKFFKPPGF